MMKTLSLPPVSLPHGESRLAELQSWLADSAARCRSMRWLGALFRVSVAQDIAADVAKVEQQASREAFAARVANDEALALLMRVVRERDLALVQQAVAHIRRSAARMHKVTEMLAGASCVALFAAGLTAAAWASAIGDNELRTVARARTNRRRDDAAGILAA